MKRGDSKSRPRHAMPLEEIEQATAGPAAEKRPAPPETDVSGDSRLLSLLSAPAGHWTHPRDLLVAIVRTLGESYHAPCARAWLTLPGDRCETCGNAEVCGDAAMCLHSVAATGPDIQDEYDRIPLDSLPEELREGHSVSLLRKRPPDADSPLWRWFVDTGARAGSIWRVSAGDDVLAVVGLTHPRRLPPMDQHLEALRRQFSLAVTSASAIEAKQHHIQQLQELGWRLAANNRHLREAHQARNLLLTSMGRELRVPLNAIVGLSELIKNRSAGEVNEQQTAYLATVASSGRHLAKLIDDLLDIAHIETGRFSLRTEPCIVSQVLAEAAQSAQPMARSRNVSMDLALPPDDVIFVTDPGRLRQVAVNLLSSAIRLSPTGESVVLAAEVTADQLVVRVRDCGPGIPREETSGFFEQFQEALGPLELENGVSGLGLPLAKRLVEIQGGTIELNSDPTAGSEFIVRLPTSPAAEKVPGPAPEQPVAVPDEEGGPVAIIAEEHAPSRLVLAQVAAAAGLQTLELASGEELPAAVSRLQPKVVLFGQALGGDAIAAPLRELKQSPETRDTPVVFLGDEVLCQKALQIGVTDAVAYPVSAEELTRLLDRVATPSGASTPKLALILDDNPTFGDAMGVILQTVGVRAIQARDGVEGLEMAKRHAPDVILLDLMMPRATGGQVLDDLQESELTRDIPVIVMTAKPLTPSEREHLEGRTAAVISKAAFTEQAIWDVLDELGIGAAQHA